MQQLEQSGTGMNQNRYVTPTWVLQSEGKFLLGNQENNAVPLFAMLRGAAGCV